jgi:hypothetical protein
MNLYAYALAAPPGELLLWVGAYGATAAPAPTFTLNDAQVPANAVAVKPMAAMREGDAAKGPGGPGFCGVYKIAGLQPGSRYRVRVAAGGTSCDLSTASLPAAVAQKLDGAFNVLLVSCYSQPDDEGDLLSTIVGQIQVQPDLSLFLGDQVYLDLPLLEDLPEKAEPLAGRLALKYRRNWASSHLGIRALSPVLARAPMACIADDHEFWNNFPFLQKQLPNTWRDEVADRWRDAALALYQDYQLPPDMPPGGVKRIDVEPLSFLLFDSRSLRQKDFGRLAPQQTFDALHAWVDWLIDRKNHGDPRYGVLGTGQSLLMKPPTTDAGKRFGDAELGNFADFGRILGEIERLTDAGVPLIYVTGDVHWGRVSSAIDRASGRTALYEVISSPSRLIRLPIVDAAKDLGNTLRGIFGRREPWPRHADPDPVPDRFGTNGRYQPHNEPNDLGATGQKGDHVALLSFTRAGTGVDFTVRYYGIHPDKEVAHSRLFGPYKLRTW